MTGIIKEAPAMFEHPGARHRRYPMRLNLTHSVSKAKSTCGARWVCRRTVPVLTLCEKCGGKAIDRHHIDGNIFNNAPGNIMALCRRCHMLTDGRMASFVPNRKAYITNMGPCTVCGRSRPEVARILLGRCPTCYSYFKKLGVDRAPKRFLAPRRVSPGVR